MVIDSVYLPFPSRLIVAFDDCIQQSIVGFLEPALLVKVISCCCNALSHLSLAVVSYFRCLISCALGFHWNRKDPDTCRKFLQ